MDEMAFENVSNDPNKYPVSQPYKGPDVSESFSEIYLSPFADTFEINE